MAADSQKSGEGEDRLCTISLSRAWIVPRHRRSSRALKIIKDFAEKHMKAAEIVISPELNNLIWEKGIKNPPREILVKMTKDKDGRVNISVPK